MLVGHRILLSELGSREMGPPVQNSDIHLFRGSQDKSPVVTDVVGNDYVCGKATSRCSTFSGQGWGLKCASEV